MEKEKGFIVGFNVDCPSCKSSGVELEEVSKKEGCLVLRCLDCSKIWKTKLILVMGDKEKTKRVAKIKGLIEEVRRFHHSDIKALLEKPLLDLLPKEETVVGNTTISGMASLISDFIFWRGLGIDLKKITPNKFYEITCL